MSNDTKKDYWNTVEAIAEKCHRDGCDPWEQVGSCYWVIYTAHKVYVYSPNKDAVFGYGDGLDGCSSMSEALSRMAVCAMVADVRARIAEM
jgi:hypothetical protein